MYSNIVLLLNLVISIFLTGVISYMQFVHFPLYKTIRPRHFLKYEIQFKYLTTYFMGVLFGIEIIAAVLLFFLYVGDWPYFMWTYIALTAINYGVTFLYTVPLHNELTRRYAPFKIRELIRVNKVRAAGWTVKALIALYLFTEFF
jgi:hypothetical protein